MTRPGDRERLRSLCPVPAGWRVLYPVTNIPPGTDLDDVETESLIWPAPVIALAHVDVWVAGERYQDEWEAPSGWSEERESSVVPMTGGHPDNALDLYLHRRDWFALIGPDEALEAYREGAIEAIEENWRREAERLERFAAIEEDAGA